jgi:hypothetical protein
MPRVGYEPTIPAFERAKTFHASDRAATVISRRCRQTAKKQKAKSDLRNATGCCSLIL